MRTDPPFPARPFEDSMIKLRRLSYVLLLTFLPLSTGCDDPGAPRAPSAPSASAAGDAGKVTPPPAVKKGRRTVTPGGQGTAEQ